MAEGDHQNESLLSLNESSSACINTSSSQFLPNPYNERDLLSQDSWDIAVKKKAKAIYDDTMWIRGLFGALDGLIISYSTFKYIFDFIAPTPASSPDIMHDWIVKSSGTVVALTTSIIIIALSLAGNLSDEIKNPVIDFMAMIWPYVRDGFKGLKFAYKGIRSTIIAAQLMGVDLHTLILPFGLVLGIAAAANRIWYRSQVTEKRKDYQKFNNQLLERAQNLWVHSEYNLSNDKEESNDTLKQQTLYLKKSGDFLEYKALDPSGKLISGKLPIDNHFKIHDFDLLEAENCPLLAKYKHKIIKLTYKKDSTAEINTKENRDAIRKEIRDNSLLPSRADAIASAVFAGFIDGLYTYMGVMGLVLLFPELLVPMFVCCVVFTVICVLNRYHEEDQYQNEFLRSAKNVELVLKAKEIQKSFLKLQALFVRHALHADITKHSEKKRLLRLPEATKNAEDLKEIETSLNKQHDAFKAQKKEYDDVYQISTGRAILIGLRNGIYCYSAISSIIFAYAAFFTVSSPALLVAAVAIGMLSLIGFATHSVIVNGAHPKKEETQQKTDDKIASLIRDMKFKITHDNERIKPDRETEIKALMDGLLITPVPNLDTQKITEVARSACSGLPKGNKGLDFIGEYWLEKDSHGHYQEASWMTLFGWVFSAFYAIVYALRAFGKGFRGANDVPLPSLPIPKATKSQSSEIEVNAPSITPQQQNSSAFFNSTNTMVPVASEDNHVTTQKQSLTIEKTPQDPSAFFNAECFFVFAKSGSEINLEEKDSAPSSPSLLSSTI